MRAFSAVVPDANGKEQQSISIFEGILLPAPLLKEVKLKRDEARSLFDCILRNIALFLERSRIHGDLSEYNILFWQGKVSIIDFAQAVDPRQNPAVFPLLLRDIERVCSHFARYGVVADARELARDMYVESAGGSALLVFPSILKKK